jgi:hypothetical protein
MDIKEILFTVFLIISVSIPLFFKQKNINHLNNKENKPNIEIQEGKFKNFVIKLEENGTFNKLNYFKNNNYIIYDLNMNLIKKKASLKAKKVYFNNGLYYFYNTSYKTNTYVYNTNKAIYNPKIKLLTSEYFTFFNKKIDGKGENMRYKDDIITAKNILYIIKGFK